MLQSEKMASRKAKEQQAATSSDSLNEIKDLLNTKFSELGTRLTSLDEKLGDAIIDIHLKPIVVETTTQEACTCARENWEDIEVLKFRLAELNDTVSNQPIPIHQLDIEVDLKNRSLRKTLVFSNIKNNNLRRHGMTQKWCWQTKSQRICKISRKKKSSETLKEPIGSKLSTETPLPHQHHLFLLPKSQMGTCWKKSNLPLLKLTWKVSRQYLSHRCTQSL